MVPILFQFYRSIIPERANTIYKKSITRIAVGGNVTRGDRTVVNCGFTIRTGMRTAYKVSFLRVYVRVRCLLHSP